jgi:hypothetical protein
MNNIFHKHVRVAVSLSMWKFSVCTLFSACLPLNANTSFPLSTFVFHQWLIYHRNIIDGMRQTLVWPKWIVPWVPYMP